MRFKIVSLLAALLLVSACASEPQQTADSNASGSGSSSSTTTAANQPAPGSVEDFIVNVGDRVFFDFDKSEIRADAQATLAKQAAWLLQYPSTQAVIEGHCDERGTREYNLALGERRASAVKDYLVSLGVQPDRLSTISYGKERPAVEGSNEAAWAQNRRGVTVIKNGASS